MFLLFLFFIAVDLPALTQYGLALSFDSCLSHILCGFHLLLPSFVVDAI